MGNTTVYHLPSLPKSSTGGSHQGLTPVAPFAHYVSMKSGHPGCSCACHNKDNTNKSVHSVPKFVCGSATIVASRRLQVQLPCWGKWEKFQRICFFKLSNRSLDMCVSEFICRKCIRILTCIYICYYCCFLYDYNTIFTIVIASIIPIAIS